MPLKEAETAWLNHVPTSGPRPSVAVTAGAVASYLTVRLADPLFPAASVQLPLRATAEVSGPAYVVAGSHVATPLTGSAPTKETPIGARYQPLPFAERAGVAVTVGAVAS